VAEPAIEIALPQNKLFMNASQHFVRKTLAVLLLIFPLFLMLGFAMHFRSWESFFHFRWANPPYNAEGMFYMLIRGHSHIFLVAHYVVYIAIPLMLIVVLCLAWVLYQQMPIIAFIGGMVGVVGCMAMSGVMSSWLSFAAIERVTPEHYEGAKAALIELTRMKGSLLLVTQASYCTFWGIIILALALIKAKAFPVWNMISLILGSILFILFMDMDNWMFIGAVCILLGLIPVAKKIARGLQQN
jgi:hypothetical protein